MDGVIKIGLSRFSLLIQLLDTLIESLSFAKHTDQLSRMLKRLTKTRTVVLHHGAIELVTQLLQFKFGFGELFASGLKLAVRIFKLSCEGRQLSHVRSSDGDVRELRTRCLGEAGTRMLGLFQLSNFVLHSIGLSRQRLNPMLVLKDRFDSAEILLEACVDGKVVSLSFEIFGFALQLSCLNLQVIQSFFKFRVFLRINLMLCGKVRKSVKFGRAGFPKGIVRQNLLRH